MLVLLSLSALAGAPDDLARGEAFLKADDAAAAKTAFSACVAEDPKAVECHWELGWLAWNENDWKTVVSEWSTVAGLDPKHDDLDKYLAQARANLDSQGAAAKLAADAPATATPAAGKPALRLRAVGDIMLGTSWPDGYLPPDDGAHELDAVRALTRDADLTFGNLEGPLCDTGTTEKCKPGSNCYAFRVPTRYGAYLKDAGFDVMSIANNHSMDFGEECRESSEHTLESLGIAWSGPPGTVADLKVNGLRIALVAFHTSDQVNDVNDLAAAKALVSAQKATHDLVIVSFHGGAEGAKATHVVKGHEMFYGEDRGDLPTFAHGVIDAGADLVLGHGPHVVRAMELYQGHLIAYSMGNFATYGRFNLSGPTAEAFVLEASLDAHGRFLSGRLLPTKLEGKGLVAPDPSGGAVDLCRLLSSQDFPATMPVIARDGSFAPAQ